jgi:hypothetical protein
VRCPSSTRISVVVPVYNREELIGETLESLLRQTEPASEIIVVDDGSVDGTVRRVEEFGSRVTLLRQENRGPSAARNAGLSVASGHYIQFFDSDDLASSNFLSAKLKAVLSVGADIAYGPWIPAWLEGSTLRHDGFVRQARAVAGNPVAAFLRGWILFIPNCLIRRDLLLEVGGYPLELMTGEDMLLLFRLLCRARLTHTPDSLLVVRQHPENQISTTTDLLDRRIQDELRLCDRVLAEIPEVAGLRGAVKAWQFRRTMAAMRAHMLGLDVHGGKPERVKRMTSFCRAFLQRLSMGAASRISGHRIGAAFTPARVQLRHELTIREMGYEPLKAPIL